VPENNVAHFKYTARNTAGMLVSSIVEADNSLLAAQIISNRGLTPVSIT